MTIALSCRRRQAASWPAGRAIYARTMKKFTEALDKQGETFFIPYHGTERAIPRARDTKGRKETYF